MSESHFKLEIGTIEDFIAFIAVIRDKEIIDIEKVREQLRLLREEKVKLNESIHQNT